MLALAISISRRVMARSKSAVSSGGGADNRAISVSIECNAESMA